MSMCGRGVGDRGSSMAGSLGGSSKIIAAAQADNAGNVNHGFGISGVVDSATGQITWSLASPYDSLAADSYVVVATIMEATTARAVKVLSQSAGSFVTLTYNSTTGSALDSVVNVAVIDVS